MKLLASLFVVLVVLAPFAAAAGGTFTVNCHSLTIQRSDPILNPGVPGGHLHAVIGGNAFRRSMVGEFSARDEANATTCDKSKDHSNYWVPYMYHQNPDGKLEMVKWDHAAVYYQKRACNYSATMKPNDCDADNFRQLAFPDGFRMIAGNPFRRSVNMSNWAETAVSFSCLGGTSGETKGFPTTTCTNLIRAQVYFPSCWNGKDLDPPDHMAHVAYPINNYNGGMCPASHPVAIFSIFYEFFYDSSPYKDVGKYVLANGDPTGYGYHGDFIMGWTDRDALQNAHANCINAADCPTLGNQPGAAVPLIYPAVYEEDVGFNGPIAKLPGNNPITWTMEEAIAAKKLNGPNQIHLV
jgi:hypothetical protein